MKERNKVLRQILFGIVGFCILFITSVFSFANVKAANDKSDRMNVVFVMDDSGSMKKTDGSMLRFEAMELFTELSAETGNYMGAVVFNDQIILKEDVKEMDGRNVKRNLIDSMKNASVYGDTDIGSALFTATDMLENQGNKSLNSAIILLTDGNTDLKNAAAYDNSLQKKQLAIDNAKQQGIKVYGICLNANGAASIDEVNSISSETDGKCVEVKSASDLKDVFAMFYGIIFDTNTIPIPVPDPDDNGNLNIQFEIPEVGVEEANIIISTLNPNVSVKLARPDGSVFSDSEMQEIEIKAKSFIVLKIPMPEGGLWHAQISGVSRDEVEVNMVYNSSLKIVLENIDGINNIERNNAIKYKATLYNNNEVVADEKLYQKYPIYLNIIDTKGNEEKEQMDVDGSEVFIEYLFDQAGEFDVTAYVEMSGQYKSSNVEHVSVAKKDLIVNGFTIRKVKFIGNKPIEIDLNAHIKNMGNTQLKYKIEQSYLDSDMTQLNDSILTIDVANNESGEINMLAIDSGGEQASFVIKIKIINVLTIALIILLIILIAVLIIMIIKKWKVSNKRINGNVEITAFNTEGNQRTESIEGTKGIMNVGREVITLSEIETGLKLSQCTLRAGQNDNSVIFSSKIPFYIENGDMRRQIELYSQMYIKVYSDEDVENSSGLILCYKADNFSEFGGNAGNGGFGGW